MCPILSYQNIATLTPVYWDEVISNTSHRSKVIRTKKRADNKSKLLRTNRKNAIVADSDCY